MSKDEKEETNFKVVNEDGTEIEIDAEGFIKIFTPKDADVRLENYGLVIQHPVKFKKVHKDAQLPKKQREFDACWDLYSVEETTLAPMEVKAIDTGLQMELPVYLEATIRPRSGMALEGLTVLNSPGTIDSGYRGNVKVILVNLSQYTVPIEKGRRIAQMRFGLTQYVEFEEVDELNESDRGSGGFGSTGH